jgi:vancomycin resistance protein VanJ
VRNPTGFGRRSSRSPWRPSRWDLLAVLPFALVAFAVVSVVHPPQSGLLALALMLEAHLFIAAFVVLAPIALLARARVLGAALLIIFVAGGGLFGSEWISLPGSDAARHDFSAMTWNLEYGERTPAAAAAQLEHVNVDLIALQELEPDASAAIEADLTIEFGWPYRAMVPRRGADGLGVLSRYPIENVSSSEDPPCLELIVDTPRGKVRIIDAHPTHGEVDKASRLRLPIDFNPSDREAAITTLRKRIDPVVATGERLLVLGDTNTAPSDPENRVLTKGLRDTHVEVGEGPGWTWRPRRLAFLPVAFVRIDRQLTAGPIFPASTWVDCSLPGDHCRLFGTYEIDG